MGLPVLLALAGFAAPRTRPSAPLATPVKLGFDYLSKDQYADLWKRADNYALAEAFLRQCGAPSSIERKMIQAVSPCIEPAVLKKVANYFRNKVAELGRKNQFACGTDHAKGLVKSTRIKIDADINEVRGMCASCFIC